MKRSPTYNYDYDYDYDYEAQRLIWLWLPKQYNIQLEEFRYRL